jgi:hypothetical protein
VQHIPDPQLVAPVGFEPAERHRRVSGQIAVEFQAFEVALQSAL